mmetsp:Transcript_35532/g.59318  ORF Transcript_35532/g.59318 Transcript_35532/m.59318 type:complete len:102 (-) Transcript_35532:88-393(-)
MSIFVPKGRLLTAGSRFTTYGAHFASYRYAASLYSALKWSSRCQPYQSRCMPQAVDWLAACLPHAQPVPFPVPDLASAYLEDGRSLDSGLAFSKRLKLQWP